ncbi:hypothetical protein GMRT_12281 [Giardia muris]|uniref:Uncharacterized protein n=1 Tax=Giardia muris TaxID=5742 RepID=A0A4Z1T8V6_GIAMU|nr:hypothetical protein GMRT_12281 [Giardia muris]|eukprot:TNJ30563.1 hypothetical protein GMRT_12281 [Giardia muris]
MSFLITELSFLNIERLSGTPLAQRVLRVSRMLHGQTSLEHQRTRPRCRVYDDELRQLSLTPDLLQKYQDFSETLRYIISQQLPRGDDPAVLRQKPIFVATNPDTYSTLLAEVAVPQSPLHRYSVVFLCPFTLSRATGIPLSRGSLKELLPYLRQDHSAGTARTPIVSEEFRYQLSRHGKLDLSIEPSVKRELLDAPEPPDAKASTSASKASSILTVHATQKACELISEALDVLLKSYRERFSLYLHICHRYSLDLPKAEAVPKQVRLRVEANDYITQSFFDSHMRGHNVEIRHAMHGLSFIKFTSIDDLERAQAVMTTMLRNQTNSNVSGSSGSGRRIIFFMEPTRVNIWPAPPHAVCFPGLVLTDPTMTSIRLPVSKDPALVLAQPNVDFVQGATPNEDSYKFAPSSSALLMYMIDGSGTVPRPGEALLARQQRMSSSLSYTLTEPQSDILLRLARRLEIQCDTSPRRTTLREKEFKEPTRFEKRIIPGVERVSQSASVMACVQLRGIHPSTHPKDIAGFIKSNNCSELLSWGRYNMFSHGTGPVLRPQGQDYWLLVCNTERDAQSLMGNMRGKRFMGHCVAYELSTSPIDLQELRKSVTYNIPDGVQMPCIAFSFKKARTDGARRFQLPSNYQPPDLIRDCGNFTVLFYWNRRAGDQAYDYYRRHVNAAEYQRFDLE